MALMHDNLLSLLEKIRGYGKENLEEILHAASEGLLEATSAFIIRFYLEDLTRGALACAYATTPEARPTVFPIISGDVAISEVFVRQAPMTFADARAAGSLQERQLAQKFRIGATTLFPVASRGRSIGVVAVDFMGPGETLTADDRSRLQEFLTAIAEPVDHARKYHQQLLLARRVDEQKRREAALLMVKSAVNLIDRITLASVLVPAMKNGKTTLDILASASQDTEVKSQYDLEGGIALERGQSLLSQYVDESGVITDAQLLEPLFFPDLTRHRLQKKGLLEMGIRSLYVVPRYEPVTRKVVCLVNYYGREQEDFSLFERGLLQTHAEMAEQAINQVGREHLEIRVLGEINDLLQERNESLQPFLTKVLSKATELIGADTGSIAIVEEREGEKWLVVEDDAGNIVGAKNKEWLKKKIPPFRIGGGELPPEERSLTGFVASTKHPKIIGSIADEHRSGGFHRNMNDLIRSEIAVPIISDEEVIAVVCLNSLQTAWFTDEHKRILEIIARLTSRHIADIQRIERLQNEVNRLTTDVAYKDPQISSYRLGNIIGNSRKSQEIVDFINTVTTPLCNRIQLWYTNVLQEATIGLPSILVLGETGAGKEFFFNNLYSKLNEMYRATVNANGELPVKKTNIAAYSGELTYSELFGHKKGAFTGAYSDRKGILEEAQGGIVFLDEIGDADPKTQVQLLRFLDNGGIVRLGDNVERYSRVLLVAATNRDLAEEIRKGNFREDLYHRLSELSVRVPSLNDRREDIPDLATHFLGKLYRTYRGKDDPRDAAPVLTDEAKNLLVTHHYTGNIRELRSILLRALFFRRNGVIGGDDIAQAISAGGRETVVGAKAATPDVAGRTADEILAKIDAGSDFWKEVYEPFSRNRLSREAVVKLLDRVREAGEKTMPRIANRLRAIEQGLPEEEEKRVLFRFKNFLYKTVKI